MGARSGQNSPRSAGLHSRAGPLAQLVEQGTFNPKVVGSSPTRPMSSGPRPRPASAQGRRASHCRASAHNWPAGQNHLRTRVPGSRCGFQARRSSPSVSGPEATPARRRGPLASPVPTVSNVRSAAADTPREPTACSGTRAGKGRRRGEGNPPALKQTPLTALTPPRPSGAFRTHCPAWQRRDQQTRATPHTPRHSGPTFTRPFATPFET
jgi:hypothetical protein